MTTPQDIITTARYVITDVDDGVNAPRQSNAEMLGYFNDGMKELSNLKPELFTSTLQVTCTPSSVEHLVTYATAQAIIAVDCIHGGAAVTPFDVSAMDAFTPGWRTATVGAATQWSKYAGDPLRFLTYPPAPATAQVMDVRCVRNPTALTLTDPITEVPSAYVPALVQYVVSRAESKDDEHVNSNRAAQTYANFVALVKGT